MADFCYSVEVKGGDPTDDLFVGGAVSGRCQSCGLTTKIDFSRLRLRARKSVLKLDLLWTNDLKLLFSASLVACLTKTASLPFQAYPVHGTNHYFVVPDRKIHFNHDKGGSTRKRLCSLCGQYWDCVGPSPKGMETVDIERRGFYELDCEFGSGTHRATKLLVGSLLYRVVTADNPKGIRFQCVPATYCD